MGADLAGQTKEQILGIGSLGSLSEASCAKTPRCQVVEMPGLRWQRRRLLQTNTHD